ncbi:hypothetical protein ANANG_G00139090 [Anguilla anguilla]|uniref:Rab-GAP TBC domain-containing protein n=1 Tax=Anguilla anguilla TaxID=7936 RepID=A0A9D3MGF2_ANGAN|nr:hypothetical protein ANANG_G00139090 [Anguilla anguilla]
MEPMSTQVDPNSEDSSSSDNMSLLNIGLPASETDRFGFILGTGSTVGAEGPPPEVIRQRETKWLNIIGQWDHTLLKKTNKVKEQCRKGIPASLRARCWPLLCYATERRSKNRRLYQTLDSSPALQTWVDMIERDIDRQFPFHEMFLSRDGHGQQGLFRVLKAYTQFRPDEGYCQGQGPVAAVLLMIMPAEEAFWCLVQISEQYLPGYYSPLLEGVLFDAAMLSGVLHRVCPSAHRHLLKHGVEPLMFATDWLMCLYARHLPFSTLLRVWDLFFCYGVRVLFQVAVVLVRRALGRQVQREECEGQMETLERLRGIKAQVPPEDDTFIEEVCSVPLSGRDLERETERELERWRKERPSSTFDPRNRCHGYQAAWGEQDSSGCSEGDISQQLEDSGNVELQGGHSGDTAQTGVPGNHSPAGDHPGPLTGQGLSQQGETESENLLSPSLLVERPKMEQAPKEVIPFSSTHSEDSTVGPTSETLPGHTGGVSERLPCLPAQVGQTAQERDPHQEEAQPTGTDPTPPEGDLISPEDQSRSGQIPSPAGPCPIVEKGSGVYRPRRAPCGKASRSRTLSEDTFRDSNHTGSEATSIISPSNHTPQDIGKRDPSHQDKSSPFPSSNPVDTPRRFALFRMLRGDRSKDRKGGDGGEKNHKASSPKMTVPTILIQDFSDGVGPGVTGEGSGMDEAGSGMAMAEAASGVAGDGLSSKQRRRGRREQERREREEEKARKKREKVMEKEKDRERKKPQTRGKSFHAHSDIPRPGNSSCTTPGSKRNSAPFFDTIF